MTSNSQQQKARQMSSVVWVDVRLKPGGGIWFGRRRRRWPNHIAPPANRFECGSLDQREHSRFHGNGAVGLE